MSNYGFLAALSLFTLVAVLAIVSWQYFSVRRNRKQTGDMTVDGSAKTMKGEKVFHRDDQKKEELTPGQDMGVR